MENIPILPCPAKAKNFEFTVLIVCPQSPLLKDRANEKCEGSKVNKVDLPDDDPATVLLVLNYLYTRNYDDKNDAITLPIGSKASENKEEDDEDANADISETSTTASVVSENEDVAGSSTSENESAAEDDPAVPYNNLWVYLAAEKFGIPSLKAVAEDRFLAYIMGHLTSCILPVLIRATMCSLPSHDWDLREPIGKVVDYQV
ncbi:hypothetical protein VTO42DRAFT_1907 [Malbranchea cinnamomea]